MKTWLKNNSLLIGILLIASVLRFYHLDFQSPWLDELHTLNEANPEASMGDMFAAIAKMEPQPQLYFILVKITFSIFGYSSFVLRAFSALIGIISIVGIYLLARRISDKRTGLFAAALLTVNYFHIYYSQEGRMYTLFVLTTIFSFYHLLGFIKKPTVSSAVIYTFAAAVMIYSHLFALFTLAAQYLILLIFWMKAGNGTRKKFFLLCVCSVVATIIIYSPVFGVLRKTAAVSKAWIGPPTADAYLQIFKDFFGQSEMVLLFVIVLSFSFFARMIKTPDDQDAEKGTNQTKPSIIFIVLLIWILITLLIPLIRSYTNIPMLVNRYFISLVPAIIIIIALGLSYISNKTIQFTILCAICVFSLSDIFIIKKHYSEITKTQFRETSEFILDHRYESEPVVSNLGWHYSYYLNKGEHKPEIIEKSLEEYIDMMMKDSSDMRPFWYAHASTQEFHLPEEKLKFLNNHFVVALNKPGHHAFANYYVNGMNTITEIKNPKYRPVKEKNGDIFTYYVNTFDTTQSFLKSTGFAFFDGNDSRSSDLQVVLVGGNKVYKIPGQMELRADNTSYFKSHHDLSNSGYRIEMSTESLLKGKYRLGLILRNRKINKEGLILTDYFYNKY